MEEWDIGSSYPCPNEPFPIYTSYLILYMPVTIMLPPLLPLLLTFLIPTLLNSGKELHQKLTVPSTTIKLPSRHLGTNLLPGVWNAGGLGVLLFSRNYMCQPSFNSGKKPQLKTWSQEERRRKVKDQLIDMIKKKLKKIANEKQSNILKGALRRGLVYWHRV